jgi:hypothetical protein
MELCSRNFVAVVIVVLLLSLLLSSLLLLLLMMMMLSYSSSFRLTCFICRLLFSEMHSNISA